MHMITTEADCARKLELICSVFGTDMVESSKESKNSIASVEHRGSYHDLLGTAASLKVTLARLQESDDGLKRSIAHTKTIMRRDVLRLSTVSDVAAPDMQLPTADDGNAVHNPNAMQMPVCAMCGCVKMRLPICARCRRIRYCTLLCQKQHWPVHKLVCEDPELELESDVD